MVNKPKKQSGGKAKKGKIKTLNLNKETVKELTDEEAKGVKGGTLLLSLNQSRINPPPAPSGASGGYTGGCSAYKY